MSREKYSLTKARWKWAALAAITMSVLSLIPQFHLWLLRGRDWQGACAYLDLDEVAYSAYINALIQGRPRRNDQFTGLAGLPEAPQPESFLSIQFAPAYAIALPSRFLGLSASTSFTLLMPITAFASSLAIFWLLVTLTNDTRLAAAGTLIVLCLSTLVEPDVEN